MRRGWKLWTLVIGSFAIAALAAGGPVARLQYDGGVDLPQELGGMDAGVMESDMDAGIPGELQGSLRGTPRSPGKTVPE